jgi:hypothetical protein
MATTASRTFQPTVRYSSRSARRCSISRRSGARTVTRSTLVERSGPGRRWLGVSVRRNRPAHKTKINSSDPSLPTVRTACPTPPFPEFSTWLILQGIVRIHATRASNRDRHSILFEVGSDSRGSRANGDHMQISGSLSRKPGSRVPPSHSQEIMKAHVISEKAYKQGKKAIITQPHRGPLGQITHVDVRLNDGERVREVRFFN